MKEWFRRFSDRTSALAGSPWTFTATVLVTVVWLILGPVFRYSDTWQLTMNTFASQLTFLMAFLLQNTQNRDSRAMQLKLDEMIRSIEGARPHLINLEELSEEELAELQKEFVRLRERSKKERPEVPPRRPRIRERKPIRRWRSRTCP